MNDSTQTQENAPVAPSMSMKGQYIKDLSFENPRAPQSLLAMKEPPKIDLNVNLEGQRLQENIFELVIHVSARALQDNKSLFLADLAYGGIFELNNIPEEHHQPVLMVDCAFTLFPYARRVVSDVTRDGGFPPLVLEPIDFAALYQQNMQQQQQEGEPAAQ